MMDIKEKLQQFKAFTVEQKKEKLLAIFEFAKDKFDFSETAVEYLSSSTFPDELVMEKLYEFIVYATVTAKKILAEKQIDNIKKLSEEAEISEKKDSEDADKLLDLINLL